MWEVSPHLQPIVNRESDTGILIPDSVGNRLQGSLKTVPLSRPRPERRLSLSRLLKYRLANADGGTQASCFA
jgi:hypothetical protein